MTAFPTNATFVAAIQAMTITGVDRHYDEPPASVDIANGYAAFPTMPDAAREEQVSTCVNNSKLRSIGYVVIVEAAGQGTQAQNYGKLAAVMDNVETALDALGIANFIEYTITTGPYPVGNQNYWAVITEITVRDL